MKQALSTPLGGARAGVRRAPPSRSPAAALAPAPAPPARRHAAPLAAQAAPLAARSAAFAGAAVAAARRARPASSAAPPTQPRRRGGLAFAFTELATLKEEPVVNDKGWVLPVAPVGTKASVFAVLDAERKVQYIGFSKDLRNSLRLLLGRRPELTHYYKAIHYTVLDQQDMVAQRTAWTTELGAAPPGNGVPAETALWQTPRACGTAADAAAALPALLAQLRARGITETLEAEPSLLASGKLDIMTSTCNTVAALEGDAARRGAGAQAARSVTASFPGTAAAGLAEEVSFDIFFQNSYTTRGGHIFDILVTAAGGGAATTHRIIVGSDYPAAAGCSPEEMVAHGIAYLLHRKVPMQTEGILDSSTFPVNYFNISLLDQWWPDFGARHGLPGDTKFWRFNKLHTYGAEAERVDSMMLGPGHLSARGDPVSAARF